MQNENNGPELRSEVIVNTTLQIENFSRIAVSLASHVIDDLTEEAIANPVVCSKDKFYQLCISGINFVSKR